MEHNPTKVVIPKDYVKAHKGKKVAESDADKLINTAKKISGIE